MASQQLYDKLKKKGWKDDEIEKAMKILGDAKSSPKVRSSTPFLYWAGLFLAIIGNMIIAVVLIPFLIILEGAVLYLIVAMLALIFGTLISVLLHDIEDIDPQHKVLGWLFVPTLAIINIYLIVRVSSELRSAIFASAFASTDSQLSLYAASSLQPVIISLIYGVCFILPYIVKQLVERRAK